MFTDTDSLVYEIKDKDDIYEDFYSDRDLFDFSDYSKDSKFYVTNKKVIGKMRDEFKGEVVSEFIGLNSKMYLLVSVNNEEKTKAKGINKKLKHREFLDVFLFNKKVIRHNMKRIQCKLHRLGTYDICKISLSCFDDKRYVLDEGVNTLAFFHKDIKSNYGF